MTRTPLLLGSLVLAVSALGAACTEDGATRRPLTSAAKRRPTTDPVTGQVLPDYNDPHTTQKEGLPNAFESLKKREDQNNSLCVRAGIDANADDTSDNFNAVTNFLCKEKKTITSIRDLQDALGLGFADRSKNGTNGSLKNPGFAFLANSSSLVARSVSSLNPRAFIFSPPPGQPVSIPGYVVMTFVRGESFVEIAAQSPKGKGKLSLYLLKFQPQCETDDGNEEGCKNEDLLTPSVESNWKSVTIYDDEDLKNNILDCRHCHQPEGPTQPLMLRMQELQDPWTHWFRNDRPGGLTLMQDYFRAHGTGEDYAGVPGILITKSDGRALEDLVTGQGFGTGKQPNEFDTKAIEAEIVRSASQQPEINVPMGESDTWQRAFDKAFSGQFIPVPYHDVKVTDPNKLQFATDEYVAFMAGQKSSLIDTRRVFLDDALEDLTMLPKTGASGKEILVQTCAQCHNPKLDQSISRAKFDVTLLDSMSRAEKDKAIERLKMGTGELLHMPPSNMRNLPDDAREAAIAELQK